MAFFDDEHAREIDAAAIYEQTAEPLTAQCISRAFEMVGGIVPSMRVLDVAAGPGALSVAAAHSGARVLATDISATMVARISERLAPYPRCAARVMDAQAFDLDDDGVDATFSMFGVINLPDWRQALREMARVTRRGGWGCVSSWRDPTAVASVGLLVEAMAEEFPDQEPIAVSEGVSVAADLGALRQEVADAGFEDVSVLPVEVAWDFPSVDEFVAKLDRVYGFMPAYVGLSAEDRQRLNPALRRAAERRAGADGVLHAPSTAHLAAGRVI